MARRNSSDDDHYILIGINRKLNLLLRLTGDNPRGLDRVWWGGFLGNVLDIVISHHTWYIAHWLKWINGIDKFHSDGE